MRRSLRHWLLSALPLTLATALPGQAPATPACSDSLGQSMAFLQGNWEGQSFSVAGSDTTLDATMKVKSRVLFGRCAIEEDWVAVKAGKVLFVAKVMRAYDAGTQRWSVYYVDDQLNSQVYEGRREAAQWRFFRTRLDKGVPIQVRLTWFPIEGGYKQLIERSRDNGVTWTLGGFVTYHAATEG